MTNRKEFVRELKDSIDNLDEEFDSLELEVRKANAELKLDWERRKLELAERRAEAARRLEAVRDSAEGTWEEIRDDLVAARDRFEAGLRDLRQQLTR